MVFGFLAVSDTVSRNARCRSGAAQSLDISHVFLFDLTVHLARAHAKIVTLFPAVLCRHQPLAMIVCYLGTTPMCPRSRRAPEF
jgi:hypothetical protein